MLVERYCVNKSNLTLHCDGKCYLAKQMAKTQDDLRMLDFRFRKNIQILHAVKEVWDHFKIKNDHELNFQNQVKGRPLLRDIHGILEEVIFDIFHPPSLLF